MKIRGKGKKSRKKEGEKRGVLYIFNIFSLYPILWLMDAVTHGSASIHQPLPVSLLLFLQFRENYESASLRFCWFYLARLLSFLQPSACFGGIPTLAS